MIGSNISLNNSISSENSIIKLTNQEIEINKLIELTNNWRIIENDMIMFKENYGEELTNLVMLRSNLNNGHNTISESEYNERVALMLRRTRQIALLNQEI